MHMILVSAAVRILWKLYINSKSKLVGVDYAPTLIHFSVSAFSLSWILC